MKIHTDFFQGSERWREMHLGRPTASEYRRFISPVQRKFSASHVEWAEELALEQITGGFEDVKPIFSKDIERGLAHEPRMLAAYEYHTGLQVRTVGFVSSDCGRTGCSPDGLVYNSPEDPFENPVGGVEGKCPKLSKLLRWRKAGVLPDEHKVQVHGCLVETGLPWWDFVGFNWYCPEKTFIFRVVPDDFTETLREYRGRFLGILAETTKSLRAELGA